MDNSEKEKKFDQEPSTTTVAATTADPEDEERLRERISQLYLAIIFQEAAPSNLQIQSVNVLQQEINKAGQTNDVLTKTYYEKAKAALDKNAALKKELQPKINKDDIKK